MLTMEILAIISYVHFTPLVSLPPFFKLYFETFHIGEWGSHFKAQVLHQYEY